MTMIDQHGNDDSGPIESQTATIPDPPPPDPSAAAAIREARAMIPVGATGVAPMNFAQQVDYAKTMALAKAALPSHLRNNAGDCLALIDIATRANLSPYMLASKTYVQNDRLCFESQAYHALAQSSGLLAGDLHPEYEGAGEERVCIVTGYLRGDPRPKVHRSPALKDVRPSKNDKGQVRGSPLWIKKPDVQLFYDTSRDWVRIYAPRATLGIYTPDELEEYEGLIGPNAAKDVTPGAELKERLAAADRSEGHRPDHVHTELANIATDTKTTILPAENEKAAPKAKTPPSDPEAESTTAKPRRSLRRRRAPSAEEEAHAASEQIAEDGEKGGTDDTAQGTEPKGQPTTATEYQSYALEWIDAEEDKDRALERWEAENDLRTQLTLPIRTRISLKGRLNFKFGIEEQ